MQRSNNSFTFKLLLSYLVLGALTVLVGYILYAEFKKITQDEDTSKEEQFIATGTLINLVYETDGLSRLALLTLKDVDFENFSRNISTLQDVIFDLKEIVTEVPQQIQLDTISQLLYKKLDNISDFRDLKLNSTDTSLDKILNEILELEKSMGKLTLETFIENPQNLDKRELAIAEEYMDYVYKTIAEKKVPRKMIDSMIEVSRFIVKRAKRDNEFAKKVLQKKENELIANDLILSNQLRTIITAFDTEITKYNLEAQNTKVSSVKKTQDIVKYAGLAALGLVLLFSYFMLSDFFRAERFKTSLQESKKQTEHLLKSREQLIATVSHDLKSPINTILGYTDLMHNTKLTTQQKNYAQSIETGATYVTKLVDDLLDLSKLEAGKLQLEFVPFSLTKLAAQIGNNIKSHYKEKDVVVLFDNDAFAAQTSFVSDPLRIQQILTNLIGNAFKFTKEGNVRIAVNTITKSKKEASIAITVSDTGLGISEEKQQFIFEEFTQADSSIPEQFGGSGLGLAISKKLTLLLSGTLTVESELSKGSTFTLTLPLKIAKTNKPNATKKTQKTQLNPTVVLIDDDEALLSLIAEMLIQYNIETHLFNSFKSFKKVENIIFDAIITDLQMPQISGIEILEKLQKGSLDSFQEQPIIAMTGNKHETNQYYIDKGFAAIITKPFTKEILIDALIKALPTFKITNKTLVKNEVIRKGEGYDATLLYSFLETDEKVMEVLQVFKNQTADDMEILSHKVEETDVEMVSKIAHKMNTMCKQLQAQKVVAALAALEHNTSKQNLPNLYKSASNKVNNLLNTLSKDFNL